MAFGQGSDKGQVRFMPLRFGWQCNRKKENRENGLSQGEIWRKVFSPALSESLGSGGGDGLWQEENIPNRRMGSQLSPRD